MCFSKPLDDRSSRPETECRNVIKTEREMLQRERDRIGKEKRRVLEVLYSDSSAKGVMFME